MSLDSNVATVDANGKVTAVAEGETEIVVATAAGKTAICEVTVTKATAPAHCDGGVRCTDPAQAELTIE